MAFASAADLPPKARPIEALRNRLEALLRWRRWRLVTAFGLAAAGILVAGVLPTKYALLFPLLGMWIFSMSSTGREALEIRQRRRVLDALEPIFSDGLVPIQPGTLSILDASSTGSLSDAGADLGAALSVTPSS